MSRSWCVPSFCCVLIPGRSLWPPGLVLLVAVRVLVFGRVTGHLAEPPHPGPFLKVHPPRRVHAVQVRLRVFTVGIANGKLGCPFLGAHDVSAWSPVPEPVAMSAARCRSSRVRRPFSS